MSGSAFALLLPGIVLTVTGIGFKLGVVPFHLWTPDVYEGAPAPVAAFVATTSKSAMVALLLRYFYVSGALHHRAVFLMFSIIAIASMCAGNLLALQQRNVKRILAYSSIAHFGYILVAFVAGGTMAIGAVSVYLAAYTVTILVAFGIVTVLSGSGRDADDLEDYRGLFWRRPLLAGVFTVALFSLAGIPATMGAVLFVLCGEFSAFGTAYYHSAGNYTTLGSGLTMTPAWRLLGPLEAATGALMFGVSTAMIFALILRLVQVRYTDLD